MYFLKKYIVLLIIFSTILNVQYSNAQQTYTISNYTVNDGLAQSTVYSTCQDSRGFLWFATYGGGVSKFDGVKFETFTTKDGLPSNKIYCITEDSKGNMWIGGREGLTIYDGYKFQNFSDTNELSSNNIRCIKQGDGDDVWIATSGGGIMKFNGESFLKYNTDNGLLSNEVYDIEVLNNGDVLLATKKGVNLFNGKRFTIFDSKNIHGNRSIRCVEEIGENEIWYGAYNGGVCKVINGKHSCFDLNNNVKNVMSILKSKNGDVWIGTFGEGVFCATYNMIKSPVFLCEICE